MLTKSKTSVRLTRKQGSRFVDFGYGDKEASEFSGWELEVIQDRLMWKEYPPQFPLRSLPAPMYEAHLAILTGKNIREAEEHEKAENESNQLNNKYKGV